MAHPEHCYRCARGAHHCRLSTGEGVPDRELFGVLQFPGSEYVSGWKARTPVWFSFDRGILLLGLLLPAPEVARGYTIELVIARGSSVSLSTAVPEIGVGLLALRRGGWDAHIPHAPAQGRAAVAVRRRRGRGGWLCGGCGACL